MSGSPSDSFGGPSPSFWVEYPRELRRGQRSSAPSPQRSVAQAEYAHFGPPPYSIPQGCNHREHYAPPPARSDDQSYYQSSVPEDPAGTPHRPTVFEVRQPRNPRANADRVERSRSMLSHDRTAPPSYASNGFRVPSPALSASSSNMTNLARQRHRTRTHYPHHTDERNVDSDLFRRRSLDPRSGPRHRSHRGDEDHEDDHTAHSRRGAFADSVRVPEFWSSSSNIDDPDLLHDSGFSPRRLSNDSVDPGARLGSLHLSPAASLAAYRRRQRNRRVDHVEQQLDPSDGELDLVIPPGYSVAINADRNGASRIQIRPIADNDRYPHRPRRASYSGSEMSGEDF